MPGDENVLGAVKVRIEGDFSSLTDDFAAAVAIAVAGGATLAEAMAQSQSILTGVETAAAAAAEQLSLFGAAEQQIPFAEANGQLNMFATELEHIAGSSTIVTKSFGEISDAAKGATPIIEQLQNLFKQLEEEWPNFAAGVGNFIQHPLQQAGQAAQEFLLTIGPMGGALLGVAIAGYEAGKAITDLVATSGEEAKATQNLADRLNLTWRETRNLEEMATIAGVSVTSLGVASFRLAETFDASSKQGQKIAGVLQSIGVTGDNSGELLKNFLARLAQIPDATTRIALAHEVLGRSSQQLIPLIKNYGDLQKAVSELGPAIGDELAGRLVAADNSFKELDLSVTRFKDALAAELAPAVIAVVDGMRQYLTQAAEFITETVRAGEALAAMIPPSVITGVQNLGSAFIWIQTHLNAFALGVRALIAAVQEFNILMAKPASVQVMGDAIQKNLHQNLIAATTSTQAFIAAWKGSTAVNALIGDIIAQQEKLSTRVRDSKAAYDELNNAYKTGTPLASGYKVTSDDVARALANLNAAQAAAALTTQKHTDAITQHIKATKEMPGDIKLWVDEQKLLKSGTDALIESTAKYNVTMASMIAGFHDLSPIDLARQHLAQFNAEFEKLGDKTPINDLSNASPIFLQVAKDLKVVTDQLDQLQQKALDDTPWKMLQDGLTAVGVTSSHAFEEAVTKMQDGYDELLKSGLATDNELQIAAANLALAQAKYALSVGDVTRQVYDQMVADIQADLDQIDANHLASTQRRGEYEKSLGREVLSLNQQMFDSISKGLADTIVNLKSFSDLFKTLWHSLASDLLKMMFDVLLNPLRTAFANFLGGIFGSAGGAAGSAAGSAIGGAGGAVGQVGGAVASTGVSAIAGLVTGAISAVTGVIGVFQNMHQETSLNAIEHNTRYTMMYVGERADGGILGQLFNISDLLTWGEIVKAAQASRDTLFQIRDILQANAKATTAVAGSQASVTAALHVDMRGSHFGPGVTDKHVQQVLDRGIRMSKLAGAFPPGRFS